MSNNPIQRISDLEARLTSVTAERDELRRQLTSRPDYRQMLAEIGALIAREGQLLREDFVGKFAGHILPAVTSFKRDVDEACEKQEKMEERQDAFELRLQKHKIEIENMLKESNAKQSGTIKKSLEGLKEQNDRMEAHFDEQQSSVTAFNQTTTNFVEAVGLCRNFASDYQKTSKEAGAALVRVSDKARTEMAEYLRDLKEELSEATTPVVRRVRELTEEQMYRRLKFTMFGFALGLMLAAGVAWVSQPSAYTQLQAKHWREMQEGYPADQAERLNNLLAEFEKEDAEREQQENKDK